MKIKSLQVSNVLSFKYVENIEDAEKISFDKDFNILIGQNGAGKSTVLEVINFIFKRVLFLPYNKNQDFYSRRNDISADDRRQILTKISEANQYKNFRLERNYDFEDKPQKIRIVIEIDAVDRANIELLKNNVDKVSSILGVYATERTAIEEAYLPEYQIDIELNSLNNTFLVHTVEDAGFSYLRGYNLYKTIINIYNEENEESQIENLAESFTLISSYRNYGSFSPHASLGGGNIAERQIQKEKTREYSRSANTIENGEPLIFGLVRLQMAGKCQALITTNKNKEECERAANELDFVKSINEKIKIVNLRVEIKLIEVSSWNYTFSFMDTKRNKSITDINSLSAGQKAIIHLVFEAYGRGNLKGGLVIIDEPEVHLHYQFQNEYLRIIEKLNREQECQYILVTHSEALISSETIKSVVRLSLDEESYTKINQPAINTSQKWLVKILDNQRSTYAFFGSKVLLVEGETDRYLFRAILGEIEEKNKKGISQDITVLDVGGKGSLDEWRDLFESFGLGVFSVYDLDYAFRFYPDEQKYQVKTLEQVNKFLAEHQDAISKIESQYSSKTFILKQGDLESYLGVPKKDLANVITFCKNSLITFLTDDTNAKAQEIKMIVSKVIDEEVNL